MASKDNVIEEKFIFTWNIKNFDCNTLQIADFIDSPKIALPNFLDTRWYLRLYPCGIYEDCKQAVSLFLQRDFDDGPERIPIKFDIESSSPPISLTDVKEYNFTKGNGKGYRVFLSCARKDQVKSCFPIVCTLRFCGLSVSENRDQSAEKILPSVLKSYLDCNTNATDVEKFKLELDAQTNTMNRQLFAYSKQCVAESEFCIENKFIEWPVDHFLIKKNDYKQVIPVVFAEKKYSLMITLTKKSDTFISSEIRLLNGNIGNCLLVNCRASLLIDEAVSTLMFEDKYKFSDKENDVWCLEEAFEVSDLEKRLKETAPGISKWKFELIFADGQVQSRILSESCGKLFYDTMSIQPCFLSHQISCLYNEKILCDATLKVKSKTFDVHKLVLCAMSPVFAAMFTNELEENKTGIVDMVDLDEDVVCDMISFMYTGTFRNVDFTNAQKLFFAADKYQILPLKNLCRDVLMDKLNSVNVYEVLNLADMHNDFKLEMAALQFIHLNRHYVLNSEAWKSFQEKDINLACKILIKTSLMS